MDARARHRTGVRFVDLTRTNGTLKSAIIADVAELITSGAFVNGPGVGLFEEEYASWCGTRECIGTANGLDALRIALLGLGIGPGDEVVVPAQTFVATLEAVVQVGATPVVADISEADYGLDPHSSEAAVTGRTRALLPVHLYGQLADGRRLQSLALQAGVHLIEDACQAHGATRDELRAGSVGHAAAFSFYPGKNLGAMGDAGALVTDDAELAATARALREHGQREKYVHELEGYTSRLDTIQALVLLRKLPLLDGWNDERRRAAALYLEALDGIGDLRLPPVPAGSNPVWHLFVIRTADPDGLAAFLRGRGIETGRHYPAPVHLCPAYEYLGYKRGSFPVAEALARECLSLPIFPGIEESEIARVVAAVEEYFARG